MRIAQILLPSASQYERKCQRADLGALSAEHEVMVVDPSNAATSGAEIAHVYAGAPLHAAAMPGFPIPYVASADVAPSRWSLRRRVAPAFVLSPLFPRDAAGRERLAPEPVEERWFAAARTGNEEPAEGHRSTVGSFLRPGVENLVEQTLARISRFREDVIWHLYDEPPAPETMAGIDLWADPAADDADFDGFVAEALVLGVPVVAARIPINELRLERGRSGALVRPGDPNEWTHAILTALFKPEVTEPRLRAAQQTRSRFRSSHRLRVLAGLYQSLIP